MAVNFNGASYNSNNLDINFNGCAVCTMLDNGIFVYDRQDTCNLNMLYGCGQLSGPATDATYGANTYWTKPNRYVCLPTSVTCGYQLIAVSDGWTAYNLWADLFFQMHSNIRIDSGTWRHVYATGGCPLCYAFYGDVTAYFHAGFCIIATNFGTLCNKLIDLPAVSQYWTNLWTCWKPFTANPTLCLCNPSMQATMRTPVTGSGLVWGAFDGTYIDTGRVCAHPLDVWVSYEPRYLVVCYNSGIGTRTYSIGNNGSCPGATAWINMCYS